MRAKAVAAGYFHTCAVTRAGGVKCWGLNGSGQLGDGTTVFQRNAAVAVSGLARGVTAIAAGDGHACAVTSAGGVECWGNNKLGQLGDGTRAGRHTAVGVSGLAGVVALAAGYYHTCALTRAGGVECWGWNGSGQIGDGTRADRSLPVGVSGLASGVTAIAAGGEHTCALTRAGEARCWGANDFGEPDHETEELVPVGVPGLASGVAAIAAGDVHTCVVTSTGGVECWGDNTNGQLGDGTRTERHAPVGVPGLAGVATLAAGGRHTCVLTSAGGVKCWGRNTVGQLGDGTTTERHSPVEVSGLQNGVAALTAGYYHTCALTSAGAVKCWGDNGSGQLGDGTEADRHTPVEVIGAPPPCIVPNVIGTPLPRAKTAIKNAHCRLGTVVYARSAKEKTSRVLAEKPTPGKHLKNGAKVKLTVGRGPKKP